MILYGYYANKLLEEGKRIFTTEGKDYREHFVKIADDYQEILDDMKNEWYEFTMKLNKGDVSLIKTDKND